MAVTGSISIVLDHALRNFMITDQIFVQWVTTFSGKQKINCDYNFSNYLLCYCVLLLWGLFISQSGLAIFPHLWAPLLYGDILVLANEKKNYLDIIIRTFQIQQLFSSNLAVFLKNLQAATLVYYQVKIYRHYLKCRKLAQ